MATKKPIALYGNEISAIQSGDTIDPTLITAISTILDNIATTQGIIIYRNASAWVALGPGTAGQHLKFGGSGANPSLISGFEVTGTGSATYDPASISNGTSTSTTITCTGAALGDFAMVSFGVDCSALNINAYVSSTNNVTVRLANATVGEVNLASSTVKVVSFKVSV